MPRKKTPRGSFGRLLKTFTFLILFAVGGYYVGTHREKIKTQIDQHAPLAADLAQKTATKTKSLTETGSAEIARLSQEGIKKGKTFYENFKQSNFPEQPSEKNNVTLDSLNFRQLTVKDETAAADDELHLCSFNIRIFSNKSRSDDELLAIADILKEYDLIAIQELRDETVLKRTVSVLQQQSGHDYVYEISPPVGREVKEMYAFLYRPDKVRIKKPGQLYNDAASDFIRRPFYATFQAENFDFTLITVHTLFGKNERDRRPEIRQLAKVYKTIQDEDADEQDVIVLGDFNFPPSDDGWSDLKLLPAMTYLIKDPLKTTITDTSLYDNFWFQKKFVKEYTGTSGVLKFDENIFQNDDDKAKLIVSDHRPIWAKFKTDNADDD